jgi:hypothetical protein
MRILTGLAVLCAGVSTARADSTSSTESQPRARVTITFMAPLKDRLGAIQTMEGRTWELPQAKDVAAELKRMNTKDGATAKPAADWITYFFYPGFRQPIVEVWIRETESDRLPKPLQGVAIPRPGTLKDKEWESGLQKGLVYEGVLLKGKREPRGLSFVFLAVCAKTRPHDDKSPPPGSAWVEGLPLKGAYTIAKGKQSSLAIYNGSTPIIVSGKLAKDFADKKGKLRVTGKLVLGDKNVMVIEADKIEEVAEKSGSTEK